MNHDLKHWYYNDLFYFYLFSYHVLSLKQTNNQTKKTKTCLYILSLTTVTISLFPLLALQKTRRFSLGQANKGKQINNSVVSLGDFIQIIAVLQTL